MIKAVKLKEKLESEQDDIKTRFDGIIDELKRIMSRSKEYKLSITPEKIINVLNDEEKSTLLIFISHDPNSIRSWSYYLGNELYEERRRVGKISPVVSKKEVKLMNFHRILL